MEIRYIIKRCEKSESFEMLGIVWICGNECLYCWCVLYYKFVFLMCLSGSVSFSVYMNIFYDDFSHF